MSVGERIYKLRNEKNLSRVALKKMSGVSESTIKQYEKGIRKPQAEQLQKIAAALNVSVDYLFGNETITPIIPNRLNARIIDRPDSEFFEVKIEANDKEAFDFGLQIFQNAGALPKEARKEILQYIDYQKSRYTSS